MTPDAGSAIVADAPHLAAPATARGEVDTAWLMDEETLLLIGHVSGTPPAVARIVLPARELGGAVRCHCLPADAGAEATFVAVLTLENVAALRPDHVEIVSDTGNRAVLSIRRIELNPQAPVRRLAAAPAEALPSILDFLGDALPGSAVQAPDDARAHRAHGFLTAFLQAISRPDGFVEIFGSTEGGGTLFQGWSFHLRPGIGSVIIDTGRLLKRNCVVGSFDRPDLLSTAKGIVGFFRDDEAIDPQGVCRIHYRGADGYYQLDVVENRTVLPSADSVPHLRDMLGRLVCDPTTSRAFKRVCRPRFDGNETITAFSAPVRAAVDLAVNVPESGTFLCGWLLDPSRRVDRVLLRGADGFYARIDDSWSRLWRPDVTDGYRADPLLGPAIAAAADEHRHGFAVFVARPAGQKASLGQWLEIVLDDESCAFLPFAPADGAAEALTSRLLTCLDPRDAAMRGTVDRHLAPAVTASMRLSKAGRGALETIPIGGPRRGDRAPRISVVLPIEDSGEGLDINLACLAGEPAAASAELVVVAAGGGEALTATLDRYARFYGLAGRLAITPQALNRAQALEAGASVSQGDALLFLAPGVLPRGTNWLGGLWRAFQSFDGAGLVSPTLLYEDDSIRFAGMPMTALETNGPPPGARGRFAGYPRHWSANQGTVTEVLAGTSECCLLPRRLFQRVGGFALELTGVDHLDVELGLRIRAAGRHCLWAPSIALYAVDTPARTSLPPHGVEVARLVDEWSFARTWARYRADGQGASA